MTETVNAPNTTTCRHCKAVVPATIDDVREHIYACPVLAAEKVPMAPTQLERRRGVGRRAR